MAADHKMFPLASGMNGQQLGITIREFTTIALAAGQIGREGHDLTSPEGQKVWAHRMVECADALLTVLDKKR